MSSTDFVNQDLTLTWFGDAGKPHRLRRQGRDQADWAASGDFTWTLVDANREYVVNDCNAIGSQPPEDDPPDPTLAGMCNRGADINGDTAVNGADIPPFVEQLISGVAVCPEEL